LRGKTDLRLFIVSSKLFECSKIYYVATLIRISRIFHSMKQQN